jgi:hypothetical protein
MKDYAGPVHVDVGMLKIVPRKKYILNVRDNFIPISIKDFKDKVKSSFTEGREENGIDRKGYIFIRLNFIGS